uniref:Uncharacterized protein n=1 Tax=Romanomermis culicivorax TaxID=13658 RepID=A0A915JCD1_ROMCU
MINLVVISVALILIGSCLFVIRYKNNRLRRFRFEKSASLTISPATFDKKSTRKKAPDVQ